MKNDNHNQSDSSCNYYHDGYDSSNYNYNNNNNNNNNDK